jgi:hypothetical protein
MSPQDTKEIAQQSNLLERKYAIRIRLLWIGLTTCILIVLNDLRYVVLAPNYFVILALLIYGGITVVFVRELRKVYRNREKLRSSSPD